MRKSRFPSSLRQSLHYPRMQASQATLPVNKVVHLHKMHRKSSWTSQGQFPELEYQIHHHHNCRPAHPPDQSSNCPTVTESVMQGCINTLKLHLMTFNANDFPLQMRYSDIRGSIFSVPRVASLAKFLGSFVKGCKDRGFVGGIHLVESKVGANCFKLLLKVWKSKFGEKKKASYWLILKKKSTWNLIFATSVLCGYKAICCSAHPCDLISRFREADGRTTSHTWPTANHSTYACHSSWYFGAYL